MSCAVNLVPLAQLHARARTSRRKGWLALSALLGLLLAVGWSLQFAAAGALQRLNENINEIEVQRSDVQRRLVAATGRRGQLRDQLQVLAQARRPQPWAKWLLNLTREAPDGVFLTAIDLNTHDVVVASTKESNSPSGVVTPGGVAKEGPPPPKPTVEVQHLRLHGMAVDHAALIQFLNALQAVSGWKHVELVRANQEAYRSGSVVAFELDCQSEETPP